MWRCLLENAGTMHWIHFPSFSSWESAPRYASAAQNRVAWRCTRVGHHCSCCHQINPCPQYDTSPRKHGSVGDLRWAYLGLYTLGFERFEWPAARDEIQPTTCSKWLCLALLCHVLSQQHCSVKLSNAVFFKKWIGGWGSSSSISKLSRTAIAPKVNLTLRWWFLKAAAGTARYVGFPHH